MFERDIAREERGPGVSSIYDAALERSRGSEPEAAARPGQTSAESREVTIVPPGLAGPSRGGSLVPPSDWSATVALVERAAATIKAYERRFVQLDIHTRALIERSAEEQARLQEEVRSLEQRLHEAEERASRAETATRDESFFRWEAERRLRDMEGRLAEQEAYSHQSDDYLRRVHSVLADL